MATYYVDRDGQNASGVTGIDSLSAPGWSLVTRAGDETKPFATIAAAITNASAGDTIIVQPEKTSTEQAKPAISNKSPASLLTVKAYPGKPRPVILGWSFTNCTNIRFEGFKFVSQASIASCTNMQFVNLQGRTRVSSGTTTGNFFANGFSSCLFEDFDLSYSGPTTGLTAPIAGFNVSAGGTSNTLRRVRIDGFPGDAFNGPNTTGQDNWTFDGLEISRATDITTVDGTNYHVDAIQWACGSNNTVFKNSTIHSGIGRIIIMPIQNSTGGTTGAGGHTNLKIQNWTWHNTTDFSLTAYNCPGLELVNLTCNATSTGNSHRGIILPGTQSTSLIDPSMWTNNVRMKNCYLSGIWNRPEASLGGGVSFAADSGYNMFPDAAARENYTKRATDLPDGKPTFVDPVADPLTGKKPNLRLVAGSPGIDAGTLISDVTEMTGVPTTDADGLTRVGLRVDIGAYEFAGASGGGGGTGGGVTSGVAGPNMPTTAGVMTEEFGADWTTPNNLLDETGGHNTFTSTPLASNVSSGATKSVWGGGYGLAVPPEAGVDGLTATARFRQTAAGGIYDDSVRIWSSGAYRGSNMGRSALTLWPTTMGIVTYGGASNLWGAADAAELAAWVAADDFRITASPSNSNTTSSTPQIDWIKAQANWSTTGDPVPDSPPVASLVVTPNPAILGATVTLDVTGSSGSIDIYEIALNGAAATPTWQEIGPGGTFSYVPAAGAHTLKARVTGPGGFNIATIELVVTPPGLPTAVLRLDKTAIETGQSIVADLSSSSGAITERQITWEPGVTQELGIATSATHVYTAPGTYTVTLNVTGPGGGTSDTETVVVTDPIVTPPPVEPPPVEAPPELPVATPDAGRPLSELTREVLNHGFDASRYTTRVRTWLNEGLGKLARISNQAGAEMQVSFDTVAGFNAYNIPGAVVRIVSVSDRAGQLTNIDITGVDENSRGVPGHYALFGGKIHLSPTPSSARTLTVLYRGRPTPMMADADTSGLPSAYEDLLIAYALWHAFRSEDDPEMATYYQGQWNTGVQEYRNDIQHQDESERRQTPGMMGERFRPQFRRPE